MERITATAQEQVIALTDISTTIGEADKLSFAANRLYLNPVLTPPMQLREGFAVSGASLRHQQPLTGAAGSWNHHFTLSEFVKGSEFIRFSHRQEAIAFLKLGLSLGIVDFLSLSAANGH